MSASTPSASLKPLLRLAVLQGNVELVADYLAKGGDVEVRDQRGRTPLMLAAAKGNAELCRVLLDYGAESSSADAEGMTALSLAMEHGFQDVASILECHVRAQTGSGVEEVRRDQFESEFFDDWLSEDDTTAPDDSAETRAKLIELQEAISAHRAVDRDGDWHDVSIVLPDLGGLALYQDLQRSDVREMMEALMNEARSYGFYKASRVASVARDVDGLEDGEFATHLVQAMNDMGFVMEDDDEWLASPVIDESAVPDVLDEEVEQYLADLSAQTNDPYFHLRKNTELSILLGRDGEERIGRLTSVALSDACLAIAAEQTSISILLELSVAAESVNNLVGRISRLGEQSLDPESKDDTESEDGGSLYAERADEFLFRLEQVRLAWNDQRAVFSSPEAARRTREAVLDLQLTAVGIRMVHKAVLDRGGDNPMLSDAVDRLTRLEWEMFSANVRLAISIAGKYMWSTLPQMDLLQEAFIGLLKAIEKFDFSKGFKFSTYATWWIRQAVSRAIGDRGRLIRLPVHMVDKVSKVSRVARSIGVDSPRDVPLHVMAKETELTPGEVERAVSSLEDAASWNGDEAVERCVLCVPDDLQGPEDIASLADFRRFMSACVEGLPLKEREIISHRFGLEDGVEKTLEEVGRLFNVTRERIRQIEAKGLMKLRTPRMLEELKIHL